MALHWYAVNLDKCEKVSARRMGEAPTWAGWVNNQPEGENPTDYQGQASLTRRWVYALIDFGHWSYTDEVRLVSDEPEEGPARSVPWLGPITDRAADYIGPEFPGVADGLWKDAPHPSTLTVKAPAPTLVPQDEEPLVMPADAPTPERMGWWSDQAMRAGVPTHIYSRPDGSEVEVISVGTELAWTDKVCVGPVVKWLRAVPATAERGMLGVPMVGEHSPPQRLRSSYDDEPPASVEELLASHPGPWVVKVHDGVLVSVVDPLGQVVAVLEGRYLAAAQLLVIARETPFYTPTSGLLPGGGK